jgi:hypothetical protein
MKQFGIIISLILSVPTYAGGGGGGCDIPARLKDREVTCTGSFLGNSFFSSARKFTRTIKFDNDLIYDQGKADVLYSLHRIGGQQFISLGTGCDQRSKETNRIVSYGIQYITLGSSETRELIQLSPVRPDSGVVTLKNKLGSVQVRCLLK